MIILPFSTLAAELFSMGVEMDTPRDPQVLCPGMSWVVNEFQPYLMKYWKDNDIEYQDDVFDCDDYALTAVTEASKALRKSTAKKCGHAYFYAKLRIETSLNGVNGPGGHATNLVRTAEGLWIWAEPQNARYCEFASAIGAVNSVRLPVP